ncbi:MAG: HXXEE domain-containing protein [Planctomycetota bacterium]
MSPELPSAYASLCRPSRRCDLAAAGSLLMFFGLLWFPAGQQGFLVEHWMKVGLFLSPLVVFFAVINLGVMVEGRGIRARGMSAAMLAAYLVHQSEEHWVDLLGRSYPLYELFNSRIAASFGDEHYGAFSEYAIFFVNTSLVWLVGLLAIWLAPARALPVAAMAGVVLVNGLAHGVQAVLARSYNPGLLTGLLIFVPLGAIVFRSLRRTGRLSAAGVLVGVTWGVIAHALLFAGVLAANVFEIIPAFVYYAALVVWAILPSAWPGAGVSVRGGVPASRPDSTA